MGDLTVEAALAKLSSSFVGLARNHDRLAEELERALSVMLERLEELDRKLQGRNEPDR